MSFSSQGPWPFSDLNIPPHHRSVLAWLMKANFNPDEPRDWHGRWTDGLSGPGTPSKAKEKLKKWPVPDHPDLNKADKAGEGDGRYGTCRGKKCERKHRGIDIQAPVGSPVVAAGDGKVLPAPDDPRGYGNQVLIDHGDKVYTQYGHLDKVTAIPGSSVQAGQQVGTVGRSGNPPKNGDSHLHFEIRLGTSDARTSRTTDPSVILPKDKSKSSSLYCRHGGSDAGDSGNL